MSMDWKYYIPHVWDSETTSWEDVYLLPEFDQTGSEEPIESLWLTVDALTYYDQDPAFTGGTSRADVLKALGSRDYILDGSDMIVRDESFTKQRLLYWARVYLAENGFHVDALREAEYEEFQGSNEHAEVVDCIRESERDGA